jgi:hypothetical protein
VKECFIVQSVEVVGAVVRGSMKYRQRDRNSEPHSFPIPNHVSGSQSTELPLSPLPSKAYAYFMSLANCFYLHCDLPLVLVFAQYLRLESTSISFWPLLNRALYRARDYLRLLAILPLCLYLSPATELDSNDVPIWLRGMKLVTCLNNFCLSIIGRPFYDCDAFNTAQA